MGITDVEKMKFVYIFAAKAEKKSLQNRFKKTVEADDDDSITNKGFENFTNSARVQKWL